MSALRGIHKQRSLESMSSSFTAVFTSVRAQQNEKAVKLAFYNTAALVFVSLSGCAAVAVYYVLEPFLRPLLWAGLCGAFLYPFKWKLTQIVRGFLRSLRESHTPLVLGAMVIPFQLANKSSDVVGSFVVRRSRIFAIFCLTAVIAYVLYIIKPFYEIVWILKGSGTAVHGLLDFFYNPYLVWTVIIGYILSLIFLWTPSSSGVISMFSLPVWIMFLLHLVSLTGSYRILFFMLLVICSVVGCITGVSEGQDQVDSKKVGESKRHNLMRRLSVAAAALVTSLPTSDSNESYNKDGRGSSTSLTTPPSATSPNDDENGQDSVEGKVSSKLRRAKIWRPKQSIKIKEEANCEGKSHVYFVALFWGIFLSRLWLHWDFIMIFIIPVTLYGLKQLLAYWSSSICSSSPALYLHSLWKNFKSWTDERRPALVPTPLNGLFKGGMKVDLAINNIMDKSMENIISIFMVLFLFVAFSVITAFFAVKVHHESAQLVSVSANLVNKVMADNPQLVNWIQENEELKKTLGSTVERSYMHGRKYIAAKIQSMFGDSNSSALQEEVLDFTDHIYHSWINWGNTSTTKELSKNGTLTTDIPSHNNMSAAISWKNVMHIFNVFDFRVSFSLIRENLGTLISLLESVWMFFKGNISFAFNLVTTMLSIVFFSGAYLLNTGISMIIFVTALFYLLSTSGEQYKPVEWFGKLTATGTSGFGDSAYGAIRDVFGAAIKMAAFYGVYTWLTHTTFGVNIIYIPSAIAAITAVVPFIGTYWAAVPAVLELWLIQGQGIMAAVLAVCHFLPTYFVDVAIYSEISGGGHPYLTGLAVVGGIYCVGLEGAIMGPIILCCLIVAFNVYSRMLGHSSPVPDPEVPSATSDMQQSTQHSQHKDDQEGSGKALTVS